MPGAGRRPRGGSADPGSHAPMRSHPLRDGLREGSLLYAPLRHANGREFCRTQLCSVNAVTLSHALGSLAKLPRVGLGNFCCVSCILCVFLLYTWFACDLCWSYALHMIFSRDASIHCGLLTTLLFCACQRRSSGSPLPTRGWSRPVSGCPPCERCAILHKTDGWTDGQMDGWIHMIVVTDRYATME